MIKNRKIIQKEFGSIDNLIIASSDIPEIGKDEILIEVYCAGISFADILAYEGNYQDSPPLPFVAGLEVSGVVKSVGSDVKNFELDNEVIALTKWGGFSEYVSVNHNFVLKKSKKINHDIGSSMIINYGTAFYTIFERLKCNKNDKVMILGASGGIGIATIEICKALGCEVIAVASSVEKLDECSKYGADKLILRDENKPFKEILKKNLNGKVDHIIDSVGGSITIDCLSFLTWEGSLVPMGFASKEIAKIPANIVLLKNISVVGVFWGPFAKGNTNFNLQSISKINDFYEQGLIKISKPTLYNFDNFKTAFNSIKERKSIGKLSLTTSKFK